jgi:hypothetical protein
VGGHGIDPRPVVGAIVAPRLENVFEGFARILDHKPLIDLLRLADPLTLRARAVGAVKRERPGFDLGKLKLAVRVAQRLGELDGETVVAIAGEIARRARV